jgi:UDP-N-acetylmuramoyl-L-alanyl-D-glutamate--2,6-diaminopimelate ligase
MLDGVLSVPQGERARVIIEPDRAAAISQAVALATPGDVIVVAGKGHETGQYVGAAVLPFDDREVTAAALAQRDRDQRGRDQPGPLGPDPLGPPGPDPLGPDPLTSKLDPWAVNR